MPNIERAEPMRLLINDRGNTRFYNADGLCHADCLEDAAVVTDPIQAEGRR